MHNPTYAHTLLIDSWIRVNEMRRCDFKLTQSLATRSSSCPVERLSSGICRLRQDELSTSSDTEMKRRLSPRHVCRSRWSLCGSDAGTGRDSVCNLLIPLGPPVRQSGKSDRQFNECQLTLNQRVQGSSPCAPTNQTIEIPTRNPCSAVLQAFAVMRRVPKRFQRLRAKPERVPDDECRPSSLGHRIDQP
jgi:hypothetical protein